jgi:hypothetical protein
MRESDVRGARVEEVEAGADGPDPEPSVEELDAFGDQVRSVADETPDVTLRDALRLLGEAAKNASKRYRAAHRARLAMPSGTR